MFNITPHNEKNFAEIVQRIYNAIFVSVCRISLTRTKRPGKNSTWINDLNHQHQKELSKVVNKMQVVPLGPKRVKLSDFNDYKDNQNDVQHKVYSQQKEIRNRKDVQYKKKKQGEEIQNNVKLSESSKIIQIMLLRFHLPLLCKKGKKFKTN